MPKSWFPMGLQCFRVLRYWNQAQKALIGGYLGSEIDEDRSKLR
jgi:hypothetical protein